MHHEEQALQVSTEPFRAANKLAVGQGRAALSGRAAQLRRLRCSLSSELL